MKYQEVIAQRRAIRREDLQLAQHLKPFGLTVSQWLVLGLLKGTPNMRVTDIANELNTSLAFVTTTTNLLVARGLVAKKRAKRDQRAVKLSYNAGSLLDEVEAAVSN